MVIKVIGEKLAKKLLKPINTSVVSILGFSNLLMGLWLVLPYNSIGEAYDHGPLFQEWVYGLMLLLVGVLVLVGVVREKVTMLAWGTGLGFVFWFTWSVFLTARTIDHIDWIWTTTYALYYGFVYVNARVNK